MIKNKRLSSFKAKIVLVSLALFPIFAYGQAAGAQSKFHSVWLAEDIEVSSGIFSPFEAENYVLPYMAQNKDLFHDKTILEIGTGSGIISLYAAKLGAKKVIATDIDPMAIDNASLNRDRLGFGSIIELRLVPPLDMTAYSVVAQSEKFDVVVSNPPFSLDMDLTTNNAVSDNGTLGPSLLKGLREHLKPGGVAVLLYRTLFYQQYMIKYARYLGYNVKYFEGDLITSWEYEALSNASATRLSKKLGIDPNAIRFNSKEDWPSFTVAFPHAPPSDPRNEFPGIIIVKDKE